MSQKVFPIDRQINFELTCWNFVMFRFVRSAHASCELYCYCRLHFIRKTVRFILDLTPTPCSIYGCHTIQKLLMYITPIFKGVHTLPTSLQRGELRPSITFEQGWLQFCSRLFQICLDETNTAVYHTELHLGRPAHESPSKRRGKG